MENAIEIGKETFEALSSSTRRNILKRLNARPKTVTELADEFVYYALTDKGRGILRSEKVKIMIILTSTAAAAFGGLFAMYMYLSKASKPVSPPTKGGVEIAVNELIIGLLFIIAAVILLYFTLKAWRESKTGSR